MRVWMDLVKIDGKMRFRYEVGELYDNLGA
jgi:hypothetical protein